VRVCTVCDSDLQSAERKLSARLSATKPSSFKHVTSHACQYLQKPQLSKHRASNAVEFLGEAPILSPSPV